ncbi:penicillin-binding protein 1A/penicillin-binding protein 2A [Melghirimyces profundicolus]|uniref:Penicillin-binding protein 1A/penicillin-binding protein 2A n=1 Tax=Melghirimyces profundicolus TaxID=1242148 RepID=A0A2T6BS27_9BACL|nr:transglycosylase domain-containing protein [Melghirimyces profundicolus]PTX58895.1 penicillin-binding protein 1A/penicillin-binding protein 2A [Melghirimyces profundicolus]
MNARIMKSYGRLFWNSMMTKKWWLLVLSTTVLIIFGGFATVMMTTNLYNLESLKDMRFATTLYDHRGKKVTTLGSTQREYVDLDNVKSKELAQTFVYVEDERFYEHNGADLKGIGRALAVDILTMSPKEGASTITMQVARNVILNDRDKTFMRKVSEIALAYNLERKYTKKEILESYLNYIYLGNGVSGIQMASKIYFGKDLTKEKLEPHEMALLAGLPKAPEGYNPYRKPEAAKQRRNVVLKKMAEKGLISEQEKEKYQQMELGVNKNYLAKYKQKEHYTAYKEYVLDEAEKRYGLNAQELVNGGYKVYTGLNVKAQRSLEENLKKDAFYQNHKNLDAGATILDPKTGEIAALGGGRHYLPGYPNRALARLQPGSSIKPLTAYAPAIQEKGYNENSLVSDAPFTYKGWTPKNYDRTFHGTVTLKEVAAQSMNAATARLLTEVVGVDKAYEYAQELGLEPKPGDKSPAPLALGGLTDGVNTLQMAQAYSTFVHDGKYTEAHTIKKIVDVDGTELEPDEKVKKDQEVFSEQTAWTMTQILKYAVDNGTGRNAKLPDGRDVAGKTGTTQKSKEAWFVGYTPEYVMATTVFNHDGGHTKLSGGEYPARIFRQVMSDTLAGTKVSRFEPPESGSSGGGFLDGFLGGDEPEEPAKPPKPEEPSEQPDLEEPPQDVDSDDSGQTPPSDDQSGQQTTGGDGIGDNEGDTTGGDTGGNTIGGDTTGDTGGTNTTGGDDTGGNTNGGDPTGGGDTTGDTSPEG